MRPALGRRGIRALPLFLSEKRKAKSEKMRCRLRRRIQIRPALRDTITLHSSLFTPPCHCEPVTDVCIFAESKKRCGDPHSKSLENTAFLKKNGLPRQCEHWLAMTCFGVCLHIEGASFDAPSMLKTQISKLAQPLASAGITISGTLLNWDRLAVAMQLPILISILTPLMPWDSSRELKRFFIRFSITMAMSMV